MASGNLGKLPPEHYAGTLAQRQSQAEYGANSVERRRRTGSRAAGGLLMPAILDGDLTIKAGSAVITGWQRVEVWISVERYPRHCIIRMTDRNPARLMEVVAPFQSCTVQIGGDLVITGYVDTVEPYYDKGTHHATVGVRGKSANAKRSLPSSSIARPRPIFVRSSSFSTSTRDALATPRFALAAWVASRAPEHWRRRARLRRQTRVRGWRRGNTTTSRWFIPLKRMIQEISSHRAQKLPGCTTLPRKRHNPVLLT
jgi:hypothetical protein